MRKNSIACASCWKGASDPSHDCAAFHLTCYRANLSGSNRRLPGAGHAHRDLRRFAVRAWRAGRIRAHDLQYGFPPSWRSLLCPCSAVHGGRMDRAFIRRRSSRSAITPAGFLGALLVRSVGRDRGLVSARSRPRSVASACSPQELRSRSIRRRSIRRLRETLERPIEASQSTLCTSDRVQVPTAIGLVKPASCIPRWVMQELSADELNQILLHELAHLGRWDDWTNLAQKVVKALFFFHPAVWWIEKRVSLGTRDGMRRRRDGGDGKSAGLCGMPGAPGRKNFDSAQPGPGTGGTRANSSDLAASGSDFGRESSDRNGPAPGSRLCRWWQDSPWSAFSASPERPGWLRLAIASPVQRPLPTVATAFFSTAGRCAAALTANAVFASRYASCRPALGRRFVPVPDRLNVRRPAAQLNPNFRAAQAVSQFSDCGTEHGKHVRQPVRMTNANVTPVAFTETLFVVVEGSDGGSPDQPVYQIQLWRMTVLHPAVDPGGNRIPAKQT